MMAQHDGDNHTPNLDRDNDFRAEVSDTRLGGQTPVPAVPGRAPVAPPSPLDARRTPRQRALRQVGIAATVLLAVVIIAGGVPALRNRAVGLIIPSPTATVPPGSNEYTLLPNPPGVTVTLDGHTLAHPPAPGDPHPLQLAPGRHTFAWQSRIFPFVPQHCTLSVPRAQSDSCPLVASTNLPTTGTLVRGTVIAMRASLFTLPAPDIAALSQAIQDALTASASSALVAPGERYYASEASGGFAGPMAATQPLHASLTYAFDARTGVLTTCALNELEYPCRFLGQDCAQLCTVAQTPSSIASAPNVWVAAALASATWTFTALDGTPVDSNTGPDINSQPILLRITWDGAQWQVKPILGNTPDLPATDDVVCDTARYWLSNSTWSFILFDPPPGSQAQFFSDPTSIDGCLVIITRGGNSAATAIFLERFGVLLAINDNASNPLDGFPSASPAAQQMAQYIAAQANIQL